MSEKKLSSFDWKFWISFFLNIIFVLYAGFFNLYEPKSEISADVVNQINVLEIKDSVPGLKVLLNDLDVFESKKNLTQQVIIVSNYGSLDLDSNRFDTNGIFGFRVVSGTILDAKVIGTSSDYLESKVKPQVADNYVNIPPFYFPRKEQFVVKLLLLHDSDVKPKVSFEGTLAGATVQPLKYSYQNNQKISFWKMVNQGTFIVHATRFIMYLIFLLAGFLAMFFLIVLPIDAGVDKFKESKRTKAVTRFKDLFNKVDAKYDFIYKIFIKNGANDVLRIKNMLEQPKLLSRIDVSDTYRFQSNGSVDLPMSVLMELNPFGELKNLLSKNVNLLDTQEVQILADFAQQFSDFLINNGYASFEDDKRARKSLVSKTRYIRSAKVYVSDELVEKVMDELPEQPWPTGTHKLISERLGITTSQFKRCVEILVEQGRVKKQIDGKLY